MPGYLQRAGFVTLFLLTVTATEIQAHGKGLGAVPKENDPRKVKWLRFVFLG